MIQRIQSIYLFLAAVAAIVFLFVPSAEVEGVQLIAQNNMPLLALSAIGALISLSVIFLFKNRVLQANIGRISLLPLLGLVGYSLFIEFSDGDFQAGWGIGLPVVATLLVFLAVGAIRKDENKVRSMDRLR